MNKLYFGDNLDILREYIKDESVDLIYLDPPFNSKRDYNLLFKTPKGHSAEAQITAFEDSWHWGPEAEKEFAELIRQPNTDVAQMIDSLRRFLGENDMMAYLTMMANRLLELHRVLKPTGSLYLHCDQTASHYLKIVLDGVFGKENFKNDIVWRRSINLGSSKAVAKRFPTLSDNILYYTKSDQYTFNRIYTPPSEEYKARFRDKDDYGYYYWNTLATYSQETYDRLKAEGKVRWTEGAKYPQYKTYLHELKGNVIPNIWTDIDMINPMAQERLGYPTQKPLALLERIIQASSNEGDVVLDPFCGCGTAVHAAQKLNRQWIGIDITHLAISLIEKRLRDAFSGIEFEVEGVPKSLEDAQDLAQRDKYQFQWWACSLVNAQPFQGKKKGSDGGIDGLIYFQDDDSGAKKIVVSVKGGDNVSVAMIRDFAHVIEREKAAIGLFVTLAEPTKPMITEAVSAGYYTSYNGRQFPKLQILTIEELLNKTKRPEYFDLASGSLTIKQAQKEKKSSAQEKLL